MNQIEKIKGAAIILAFLGIIACTADPSEALDQEWEHSFSFDWKFARGEQPSAMAAEFDDLDWEKVDLPHDWAISGPFGPLKSMGNTGKLPWKGEGWYRKRFDLPA